MHKVIEYKLGRSLFSGVLFPDFGNILVFFLRRFLHLGTVTRINENVCEWRLNIPSSIPLILLVAVMLCEVGCLMQVGRQSRVLGPSFSDCPTLASIVSHREKCKRRMISPRTFRPIDGLLLEIGHLFLLCFILISYET